MTNFRRVCVLLLALVALAAVPSFAQDDPAAAAQGLSTGGVNWGFLSAAFAIAVAAAFGAVSQAKATSAAVSAMARNPGAAGNIRTTLIIGLALIESLVIYALLIALRAAGIF